MPRIIISKQAADAVRARADNSFKETGTTLPDGTMSVPIGDDTLERLESVKRPGESWSDVLMRMMSTKQ